jgi:hypothetical protein
MGGEGAMGTVEFTPAADPAAVAGVIPLGSPIMEFGKDEPCCGGWTKVQLYKDSVVVKSGHVCPCCGDRMRTRKMMARHTITDYNVTTTTCCWFLGPLANLCCLQKDLVFYQSNNDSVKLTTGEKVPVPREHHFTLKGAVAEALDGDKIA